MRSSGTVAERLQSKLVTTERGCQEFTGWCDPHGYGRFKADGQMRKPHRVAYQLWVGPIPPGMHVLHRCDNPPCCNPDHLFLGTPLDNARDRDSKGRGDTSRLTAPSDIGARLTERAARLRVKAALAAGHPADWKRCPRCHRWGDVNFFGANPHRPDGRQSYCRSCQTERRQSA